MSNTFVTVVHVHNVATEPL